MPHSSGYLSTILRNNSGIEPGYRHAPKHYEAGQALELSGSVLKWYELHSVGTPVPREISELARRTLGISPSTPSGLGFAILHRCGSDFYFLIACTWRNSNEIWETVFYKNGETMAEFALFPREAPHLPTFCVWELAPVMWEKAAWERFLGSQRDLAAAQAWRSDLGGGAA